MGRGFITIICSSQKKQSFYTDIKTCSARKTDIICCDEHVPQYRQENGLVWKLCGSCSGYCFTTYVYHLN